MERSPQGRWSISDGSNSRQVGVWKYGTTWCRWVLHSFVYSDFHQQWCPWWEVTTVLPAIGVLETFAHHDEASGKIPSPLIWWCLCFAAFTWRSKLEWCLHRSLDFVFCEKEVLMANVITFGSFENFPMKVVGFQMRLWRFCHVCWKNKWYELGSFSRLRMPDTFWFGSACQHVWTWVFLKQIENKQPICTNQFSMCLPRWQFYFWNCLKQFRMSQDILQKEMCVQLRIFHLKEAQEEPSLVQRRVKATGQET